MKLRKPDYYDRFQCIAGACSDSCCIGWEIDINEQQQEFYAQAANETGELGQRMKTCIDWEEGHFILQGKEERCPFLNRENLCDLIIGLGEDSLCDICREHPRFYDWFDGLTEVGLGLCCEAAGRLILEKEDPVRFVMDEVADQSEESDGQEDPELLKILFSARDTAIQILQNRGCPVRQRLVDYLEFVERLQEVLDFGSMEEIEEVIKSFTGRIQQSDSDMQWENEKIHIYQSVLALCKDLEPIDDSWLQTLAELENMVKQPQKLKNLESAMLQQTADREYEYEHLAVYFVYRYFMKCREDGDVYSKGCLAVFCLLLIRLLDVKTFEEKGTVTTEDRVQNVKCISKEIEYSEENLDTLADAFWARWAKSR